VLTRTQSVILTSRSARPELSGVQPSLHPTLITCSGASSWCRIHPSLTGLSGIPWILNPCYGDSISKQVITMKDSLRKLILEQANATIDIKRILINLRNSRKPTSPWQRRNRAWSSYRRCGKKFDTAIMTSVLWQQRRIGRSCLTSLKKITTQRKTLTIKLPITSTRQ